MTEDHKNTPSELTEDEKRLKIYTAACFFATGFTLMDTIARRVGVSEEQLAEWVNTPIWKEALQFWGESIDTDQRYPKPRIITDNTPPTMRERYLIMQAFQKDESDDSPVRFVTYDGIIDKRVKDIRKYEYVFDDDTTLDKIETLLVFQKRHMHFVKLGVKRRTGVATRNLRPIRRRQERPKVRTNEGKPGDRVECVMRNGLVVTGEMLWKGKYNFLVRVGDILTRGKVVIVYKHGLYNYSVLKRRDYVDVEYDDEWEDEKRIAYFEETEDGDPACIVE